MINKIKRWYYRLVPTYRQLEVVFVSYIVADRMIKETTDKPEREQWHIAPEEDRNQIIEMVYLERRERITE